jgi:hypothetical protein
VPAPAPPFHPDETRRASSEPLTGSLSRLHITVSNGFLKKLDAARDALSHALPGANVEAILEGGLDLLLKQHARRKGLVEKPRKIARAAKPDTATAKAKREVWKRDGGRCQWPLDSGGRFHNDMAARKMFGDHWMNQFTKNPADRRNAPLTQGLPSG